MTDKLRECRFCTAPIKDVLLDLGRQPPSNSYLNPEGMDKADERKYPLRLGFCDDCGLCQLIDDVPPEAIFHSEYAYFSSFSSSWLQHAASYSEKMIDRFDLGPKSFVVEVASNDGYLLRNFVAKGIPCLGFEPAANCAEAAAKVGVPSHVGFFNSATASEALKQYPKADLIAANNVFAHVSDPKDFIMGFATMLADQGVATFEFPHLETQVLEGQFDTIYHEHYSYLSLTAIDRIFAAAGLRAFSIDRLTTHGGSLRVYACRVGAAHAEEESVAHTRETERRAAVDKAEGVRVLAEKAAAIRASLLEFVRDAKANGKSIAAYGAAAKGNTLLNFCGLTDADIAFVVDKSIHKQNRLLPGSHIPILPPEALADRRPDYVLILPWNLKEEIMQEQSYISGWGGRFVLAQPHLRVL